MSKFTNLLLIDSDLDPDTIQELRSHVNQKTLQSEIQLSSVNDVLDVLSMMDDMKFHSIGIVSDRHTHTFHMVVDPYAQGFRDEYQ